MILKISLACLAFLASCGSEMETQGKPEVIKQERITPPPLPPKPPAKKLVKRRPLPPIPPPKTVNEPSLIKALKDVLKKRRDKIEEDDEPEEKEWSDD